MLEYLGLSGGGISGLVDVTGAALSELSGEPWFWPAALVAAIGIVVLVKRS